MSKNRKLASVQRVYDVTPIDGADRIELAHVLGWQCVVKKGEFKPGDIGIYFEIDSFLPVRPEFEFLRPTCYKDSVILGPGFRLRTQKFRGQVSQGLLLPVSLFPKIETAAGIDAAIVNPDKTNNPDNPDTAVGTDVTELLGVRQWEIEERVTTGGTIIGTLPSDVPHTDETRIQAMPALLEEFREKDYYISTKLDGSSHSISIDENGFHVTGHNFEYRDDDSSAFYRLVKSRNYKAAMEQYIKDHDIHMLTIQGEFCAPGIQRNRLKLTKPEWYVFTVRIDGKRVGLKAMQDVAAAISAPVVPIEEIGYDLPSHYSTVEALLERADGSYPNGGPKEGIVIRTVEPEFCRLISAPLSMKVVSNRYLLKNE